VRIQISEDESASVKKEHERPGFENRAVEADWRAMICHQILHEGQRRPGRARPGAILCTGTQSLDARVGRRGSGIGAYPCYPTRQLGISDFTAVKQNAKLFHDLNTSVGKAGAFAAAQTVL
jgi:hypothetical protein